MKRTSEARTLTTASWTSACGRDLVSASQPSTVVTLQVLVLLLTWQLQVWQATMHPRAAPTAGYWHWHQWLQPHWSRWQSTATGRLTFELGGRGRKLTWL